MTDDETVAYLNTLAPGDEVVETSFPHMNCGMRGVVYRNEAGHTCVMWENKMGTSVTWGTRRLGCWRLDAT